MSGEFVSDINEIRRRARKHMEDGAVTDLCQLEAAAPSLRKAS